MTLSSTTKHALKVSFYTALTVLFIQYFIVPCFADFAQQVEKVETLMFGKIAGIILGGCLLAGGGYTAFKGELMKGLAQVGVGLLVGVSVALSKSGAIFSLLQ